MAIYMLFDNPADKQNMTFLNGYETAKIRQVYPSQKCNSIKEMLAACKDMIKQSAEGDTIICWYDFMAVLCWWLCKVQFKKQAGKVFIQANAEIKKCPGDSDFKEVR